MMVHCATSNPGKLREFQLAAQRRPDSCATHDAYRAPALCGGEKAAPDFDVRKLPQSVEPPEETANTFEENAMLKAVYYGQHLLAQGGEGYLFADDSGLEVDALGGAPGVHSARYAGDHATDADNNALLLKNLAGIVNRTARFVCVIALVKDGQPVRTFRGSVEGRILDAPHGTGGFGYDPLFYHPRFGCTFGEAPIGDKMLVSHRAQALNAMFAFLREATA